MELHKTYIVCRETYYGEDRPYSDSNPVVANCSRLESAKKILENISSQFLNEHADLRLHAEWDCVSSQIPCRLRLVQENKKNYLVYSMIEEGIIL